MTSDCRFNIGLEALLDGLAKRCTSGEHPRQARDHGKYGIEAFLETRAILDS